MDERIIEKWECKACDPEYPCRIEITANNKEMPEHLKSLPRFKRKVCICNEQRSSEWILIKKDKL